MAHAPALLRTQTAPMFSAHSRQVPSGTSSVRTSQLSGSTQHPSTASLSSLATTMASHTSNGIAGAGGPVMATSNIINQRADASRSLYQICVSLRQRLAQVPGFERHLERVEQRVMDGPVESLWDMFRTGQALLTIYNACVNPIMPLAIEESNTNESKRSKLAIFRFVEACLHSLGIPAADCFVINDLLGNDTSGLVKVISVVNYVLDIGEENGRLTLRQPNPGETMDGAAKTQMTYCDHIIKEMVDTERKYVQDLENLHDLKRALEERGVITGDVIHQIFLNINSILDFQRRFLIKIETTNSIPRVDQRWGIPFLKDEDNFNTVYQPFIANQRKAALVAKENFDKIQQAQHAVACDFNTLDGFLLKPMQRLVKYPLLLKDLLKKTEDPSTKDDLSEGIDAAERVLSKANEAVDRDLLEDALEDLTLRVDDWKNLRSDAFGRLLMHGAYQVLTGNTDRDREFDIYLFESILLCCKEAQAPKKSDKKDKSKSAGGKPVKKPKLFLKGRIFMSNVTDIVSYSKPGSYTVQIWWKGDPGVENFIIKFINEDSMKKWAVALDQQRKDKAPPALASTDEPPAEFAWMRNVSLSQMDNPYAQQNDSDDEDAMMVSNPISGVQASGGVMTRNASSNSLRSRSATSESVQNAALLPRQPPSRFPMPGPHGTLSLQTQGVPPGASSPGPRVGESYFSPTSESPASTRTSTTSNFHFSGQYPFPPKTGTPQPGWEEHNRYTAPAMPRAPSRDGSSPVNAYPNGRNPRGPSMPALASHSSAQSLAQQQRNRSYSTPDINQQAARKNSNNAVPAVPGIPAHIHDSNQAHSRTNSPMQDMPTRAQTNSPGVQRERMHQHNASFGGKMSQFPSQPAYPGRTTPGLDQTRAAVPAALQVGNPSNSSPSLAQGLFSPNPDALTQLKVKVNYERNNYITLVVAYNITYQLMVDRIDAKLARFTTSSISKGNLKLRYRDEDGDFVNIESDEDIQITFMEFREGLRNQYNVGGVGEIELFCVGETG